MATAPRNRKMATRPVYEPVLELPPLPADQYDALRTNIALNGVLVPILVDGDGPLRRIIDGSHRRRIAEELGYECPEIAKSDLSEQEKRTLARTLNLARRQLDQASKRAIIADQLRETPRRSTNWVAKQLGVHHATVATVRASLVSTLQIAEFDRTEGADGKYRPTTYATDRSLGNGSPPPAPFQGFEAGRNGAKGHHHEPLIEAVVSDPGADETSASLLDFGEEAILRAAAEIRQRRVADQLRKLQEQRRATQPAPVRRKKGTLVLHGDCLDLIPTLEDGSVALVVTSPPYADQRSGHYEGIPEVVYPEYTARWMEALRPKLRTDGSVLVVIRPHLRDGVLSDYVLRTRLALREAAWKECEELIWCKPDAPPLGSVKRPRRTWESILWYSLSNRPFCDLKACGKESDRIGFISSLRFGEGGSSPVHGGQSTLATNGIARIPDVLVAPVGANAAEAGVDHPAVFPQALAEQLIRTFSQEGDLILDPFCGSGQTLLAARQAGRRYLGIDREEKYARLALERLGR